MRTTNSGFDKIKGIQTKPQSIWKVSNAGKIAQWCMWEEIDMTCAPLQTSERASKAYLLKVRDTLRIKIFFLYIN